MIAFLRGKFHNCTPTFVQMEVGGIGYGLNISLSTYEQLKTQKEGQLFTHLHISDTAHVLYGFATEEEKSMFLHLISISGVGPSIALAALSTYKPKELRQLIQGEETIRIQQIKGIGKKTAQRIVLELGDKLVTEGPAGPSTAFSQQEEALRALVALGLSRTEAERNIAQVLQKADSDSLSLEEMLKRALYGSK